MRNLGYSQARWKRARALALERAHYVCQRCGSTNHLVVHHIDGQGMTGRHSTRLSNLIVLCARCHRLTHARTDERSADDTAHHVPSYRRE